MDCDLNKAVPYVNDRRGGLVQCVYTWTGAGYGMGLGYT